MPKPPGPPLLTTTALQLDIMLAAIKKGELDDDLPQIAAAVSSRNTVLTRIIAAQLSAGDTVHFSPQIRPRYLMDLPATVVRVSQKSVTVDVPDQPEYLRYAGVRGIRVPNEMIRELA